ncbi:hypothetical protein BDN72DRAFT_382982 [Pluteus cervinus]|uniref:Uncharacterized protein n=1 Tax=Pluteus cervinus TaxID=181527 RepID=A0ACD3AA65_9AGAR|nr:hypothetical protein BDN72DRAFT_382982 [Pluteus cervinus]
MLFASSHPLCWTATLLGDLSCYQFPPLRSLFYHARILFLFTKSDMKTILLPVTVFSLALVSAPFHLPTLLMTVLWIWVHLLHFCIANQYYSTNEDALNKPWRPLPSGLLTTADAFTIRWSLVPICLFMSILHRTLVPSLVLLAATWLYNDCFWNKHGVVKNFLNVVGYLAFECGAAVCLSRNMGLTPSSTNALITSGLIILTTVHAGDFPDIGGDLKEGRNTLPILFPTLTRHILCATITLWTGYACIMTTTWSLAPVLGLAVLGTAVAEAFRNKDSDRRQDRFAFILYNVWLSAIHVALAATANTARWQSLPTSI